MNCGRLPFADVLRTTWRLLTFRLGQEAFEAMGRRHLVVGLIFTWIAGVGRYWDSPRGHFLQYAGLGSVIYVVFLAGVLWVVIKPLTVAAVGRYRHIAAFLALTSPLAWLYAIPVERFMERDAAANANLIFLQVVALWRVVLLVLFLRRAMRLGTGACIVALLLPLSGLVMALALLNLEHVVMNIMGGLRDEDRSPADLSYQFVVLLAMLSTPIFAITFCTWIGMVIFNVLKRRKQKLNTAVPSPG